MLRYVLIISLFLCSWPMWTSRVTASGEDDSPFVRIELVSDAECVEKGGAFRLGLLFRIADGAHIYWQNPGDAGLPPSIEWSLPAGFAMDELNWPAPGRIEEAGGLIVNVYEGEVLLFATVHVPPDHPDGTAELKAGAEWMVCKEFCTIEKGSAEISVVVGGERRKSGHFGLFERFTTLLPAEAEALPHISVEASWLGSGENGKERGALITIESTDRGRSIISDPETVEWYRQPVEGLITEEISVDEDKSDKSRLVLKVIAQDYAGDLPARPYDWGLLKFTMRDTAGGIETCAVIVRFNDGR